MPADVAVKRSSRGAPTFISMRAAWARAVCSTCKFAPTAYGPNIPIWDAA